MILHLALLALLVLFGFASPLRASAQSDTPSGSSRHDLRAEEDTLGIAKEEETVVTASRHAQRISEAPSNVYVITDDDIRMSGAIDLPTVLRRVPGLEVMQMSASEFNVSARGNNQTVANKMLVLIDGRSIYLDIQGALFWKVIPITLPEIKRIEVLKGPASALYGFNAFDGVINIITKTPQEMKGTTLQFGGGEYGTITASATQAGSVDKFGYRLSVGHDQTNQWRNRDALSFRSDRFNALTEYRLSPESRVFLEGGLVDANRNEGPFTNTVTPLTPAVDGFGRVGYERKNFFVRAFYRKFTSDSNVLTFPTLAAFGPGGTSNLRVTSRDGNPIRSTKADTVDIEAQHALEFGSVDRLTYGVNYRHNMLSDNWIDQFSREDRLGLYVQNEWMPTNQVTLVTGLRYDLHTEIPGTISPRAALIYRPAENHTFRAAISLAYRQPTLTETHNDILQTTTLFGVPCLPFAVPPPCPLPIKGSSNLSPEQIISYELGYQGWFLRHRLRARADVFFNHISDLIEPETRGNTVVFVNNQGAADIYGGELGLEFRATSWLSGFANYSIQEIGQSINTEIRRAAPRFKFNAGLQGDWENGINGEVVYHYYGSATYPISTAFSDLSGPPLNVPLLNPMVGSYSLLNIRVGYRFWKDRAEAAVSAFNALNDRHQEHPLGETIGSRVMGWLTLRL
ncbi:TonB-dependent receptor [Nitrospira tepida]|uniref:TonB-dependent receptor n=1 Tax=Nitrospira tepida TaxID=2973512 RepID=A0AA86T9N7_9BACT|nr:TonB-dependent receptor [Nitrospira tepida]CAI4030428.1 TonB-dependent receptor [Nitrospira tepida]